MGSWVFKADNDMRAIGRRRDGWRQLAAAMALAACLLLALPVASPAEPIRKGTTQLRLSRDLMTALKADGMRLTKLREAKARGRVVSLPIGSGEVDLTNASGSIEHDGGFALVAGRRTVEVTALRLDTAKHGLWGKLDGRRLKLASFAAFTVERDGFGDDIGVAALKLRPMVAHLLNSKLGLRGVFPARAPFASLSSGFKPLFDTVASGSLVLTLDPITLAKLGAAGVTPAPFEALVLGSEPPSYAASLSAGAIYPDLRGGSASVDAGLRLSRATPWAQLSWTGLSLSLETNKLFADTSVASGAGNSPKGVGPIAALDLSGATARVDRDKRTVTITGARVTLEASAAQLINETFAKVPGQQIVASGELLGTLSLWMTGR